MKPVPRTTATVDDEVVCTLISNSLKLDVDDLSCFARYLPKHNASVSVSTCLAELLQSTKYP
jgi:hypothetical protein